MINAIHGRPVEIRPDYITILTPGGVEYRLEVTRNTSERISAIPQEERENIRVFAYLQHREDAMVLFGFSSEEERFCFEQLQTVPGIGVTVAGARIGTCTSCSSMARHTISSASAKRNWH